MIERARGVMVDFRARLAWHWYMAGRAFGRFWAGINWTAVLAFLGFMMLTLGLYLVFGRGVMLIVMGVLFLAVATVDALPGKRGRI